MFGSFTCLFALIVLVNSSVATVDSCAYPAREVIQPACNTDSHVSDLMDVGATPSAPAPGKDPLPPISLCSVPAASGRRRLRVVVYARFSTDEQNPRSIDDQIAYCRAYIDRLQLGDVEIIILHDAAVSGERLRRPGIDAVWELIESHGCDVIVAEDLSRIYRHATRAMDFIEAAVDEGIRVIAINSHLDTSEGENRWRLGGHFASLKAELDNSETRDRIKRTMERLWSDGFAVGDLKPGYVRIPTAPATDREPARGPHRDRKDERWTPVITKAFQMIAQHDPPWLVAKYLTQAGLPKSNRSRLEAWSEQTVIRFIRSPIYKGLESFRVKKMERKLRTGKKKQVRSNPNEILWREMPHLAHVPVSLWNAANRAIDERNTRKNANPEKGDPRRSATRDRRSALSELLVCGVCGAKMYRVGDYYRCANSRVDATLHRGNGKRCWNRCLPIQETVRRNLASAILGTLNSQEGCFAALCCQVVEMVRQGAPHAARRLKVLQKQENALNRACDRLTDAIERDGQLEDVIARLQQRRDERDSVRREIATIVARNGDDIPLPTPEDIRKLLADVEPQFLGDLSPDVGPFLGRIIDGKIEAVPHVHFDSDDLHLRARFSINLLRLLPQQWQDLLGDNASVDDITAMATTATVAMVVDLFRVSKRYQFGREMHALVQGGLTIADAARQLGLPETTANRAYRTGEALAARGLTDPFIEATEMPKRPKNWRPRSARPDVFDAA